VIPVIPARRCATSGMTASTTLAVFLEVAHGRAIFGSAGIAAGVE
jgi:hypothetical protein